MTLVRPPFDPDIETALHDPANLIVTSLVSDEIAHPTEGTVTITQLREREVVPDEQELTHNGRFVMSDHLLTRPGGPDLRIWLWRPQNATGPLPLIYHIHGGGLVVGSARVDIPAVLALATGTGCMVASVEYRLAPESPYPAAVDDCYAGLEWLSSNAYDLGLAPERIIIEGVSAGGGLAAATTLMARERGGPRIAAQLLCCPMLDDRNDSASAHQMQGAGAWDRTANATGWAAYLGVLAGGPLVPETAAPARASDLTDVPVAFLDVGSAETFRDEVLAYADLLWRSGVSAELHVWPGGCHGFDFLTPDAVLSRQARAARVAWLNRTLTHLSCAKES